MNALAAVGAVALVALAVLTVLGLVALAAWLTTRPYEKPRPVWEDPT